MKTSEEMREIFRAMPSKKKENPYWEFDKDHPCIRSTFPALTPGVGFKPFILETTAPLLTSIRDFFRCYYESFQSEAQVLCVTPDDADKLHAIGVPILTNGMIGPYESTVVILPQDNSGGTSRISEGFWQNRIINAGIVPLARIHSHHILDPYQSMIDYSTLNSGTLEMVLGTIFEEPISVCYWLDVPGTDIKAQTFLARQKEDGTFEIVPYKFHGIE